MNLIRPIQSLRGLAVLLVVLGHWGLFFGSGFIGVDVFFVISGYVITLVALRRVQAGEFGGFSFLVARFRRLFPALGAVVLAVVVFQLLYYPPFEWSRVSEEGLWSLLWMSNLYAHIDIGDYFGETAGTSLLLHTWSLSVEFQAYAVLAFLFLWFMVKLRSLKLFRVIVFLLSLVSLSTALLSSVEPSTGIVGALTSYFSPITRFYQIGAGVLLATWNFKRPAVFPFTALGTLAIILTAALPAGMLSWNESGLIAVAGALGFIYGIGQKPILEPLSRLFGRIGDMSYSIYLWHWPIMVIVQSVVPSLFTQLSVGFVLTGLLSIASHRFLEVPFMRRGESPVMNRILDTALPASAATLAVTLFLGAGLTSSIQPEAYDSLGGVLIGDVTQVGFGKKFDSLLQPCADADLEFSPNVGAVYNCYETTDEKEIDVLVLGNSHAAHLVPGIIILRPDIKVRYLSFSGGFKLGNPELLRALDYWDSSGAKANHVYVNSFWEVEGTDFGELSSALDRIEVAAKEVFIFDDVPNFKISPVRCKYSSLFVVPTLCEEQLPNFHQHIVTFRDSVAKKLPFANLVKSSDFFLLGNDSFSMAKNGEILFRDQNHLNVDGSYRLAAHLLENGSLRSSIIP